MDHKIIVVNENEISLHRAKKEAMIASMKGQKIAFDLRNIEDSKRKAEIIMFLNKS
ncbi:hypothetical protein [Bacillus methanolicus]|uniref:hypothetical protein n=1 Tax=Bacillus methanolicus TaxID=1471 RepID=UPI002380192D|nr:hypothetical protein [Bacillus methanolicus]